MCNGQCFPNSTVLTIVCAWCGKTVGTKDGKGQTGITHTICPECSEKAMKELKEVRPDA